MVYYKKNPTVNDGIGTLFDTPNSIKNVLVNMLGSVDLDDRYVFISEMETEKFREYYQSVTKKCDELNELFKQENGINSAVVFPKLMYVCHNLESCYLLKDYFQRITDSEELARSEILYQSTYHVILTLDISIPLL